MELMDFAEGLLRRSPQAQFLRQSLSLSRPTWGGAEAKQPVQRPFPEGKKLQEEESEGPKGAHSGKLLHSLGLSFLVCKMKVITIPSSYAPNY